VGLQGVLGSKTLWISPCRANVHGLSLEQIDEFLAELAAPIEPVEADLLKRVKA
jgi:hypothetical protein